MCVVCVSVPAGCNATKRAPVVTIIIAVLRHKYSRSVPIINEVPCYCEMASSTHLIPYT